MSDDEIDHADCRFRIEIGDSIRRSLIRYFRGWIGEQLKASDAASLSTPEAIDKFAWRLSAGFIAEVEDQMQDSLPEAIMMASRDGEYLDPSAIVAAYTEEALPDFLDEVTKAKSDEPLEKQLSIWSLFLDEISDAPLVIL